MEYSHKLARSTTDTLEKLVAFIEERRRSDSLSADVAEFEKDVRALCSAVERAATTEELARFDVHAPAVRVDGVVHRFVLRSECEYLTSAGPVRVERNLYADRSGGGRALCPLERRAGVIRGYWTPRAAQLATWVTAHLVPGEAEQLFGRLGGMTPSRSTLDRLPKELSERWERQRAEFEQSLRLTEEVPQEAVIVAVSLDGVMVPMKAGQRKEKRAAAAAAGKPTRGPAGYCEAACATVTVYDHERAPLHTVRMGRMPESKKATIKGRFCCKVWDHARESVGWTSLRGQSEHLVDQLRLPDHVALRHPSRLSLAERMHDLDAAQGPPRRGESLEAQHRPGAAFDESVVLLDDVVQILALAKIRTRSDESLVSDGLERDRVGGVLVHGHHARGRRMSRA